MPFVRAGQLCRDTPVARADDSLGLVAENLRESQYSAIPVVEGELGLDGKIGNTSRVIGIVFERDLSSVVLPAVAAQQVASARPVAVSPFDNSPSTVESDRTLSADARGVSELRARDVMRIDNGFVPSLFSLPNVLLTLDRYDCDALPVIDESGNYRGMISRSDAVAALGGAVRPPSVGGMATPLGVWLTTGHVSAGAPPLGLVLSGFSMFAFLFSAHLVMLFLLTAIRPEWGAMFYSGRIGMASDNSNTFNLLVTGAEGLLFLLFMRLSPIAGTHAAEHQTVHAIERGVELTPENVCRMPRAHPRCGTNLVALSGLIQIVFRHLPDNSPAAILFALLFIYFFWRSFGEALQIYFTTKPASPKQLESGIRAGKAIIEKYQSEPHLQIGFGARLWNSGMGLAAVGLISAFWLFSSLETWAARWILG
ncbi:MAG TPA: DUF1385 domain-containing protein [Abditibacteriaceae bacterium]|jgi:CBS domain-containing protein